jgi:hypothetical protein
MRAHGFNGEMIADLLHSGLAATECDTMAGAMPTEVVRIKITDAGRDALKAIA